MTVSPRQRMWFLSGTLILTLVVGFSLDGDGKADLHDKKEGRGHLAAARRFMPSRERGDDVPVISVTRRPPAEEISDVFRSTSWYVPPPPPEPAPPAPPPLPFSYIGMMQEAAGKVVFLSKQDNNYAIRKGDVIEGIYRVEDVNEREVVLTYLPLNMKQNLFIGGRN